jgi:glycyl-tRNA synthetase
MAKQEDIFKNVISHAKEYGFIFPSSEIYDGLSAVYDYAQNGVEKRTYGILVESHGSNE